MDRDHVIAIVANPPDARTHRSSEMIPELNLNDEVLRYLGATVCSI